MIGKRRRLLYLVALLGLPFGNSQASVTWQPSGDLVDDGYAYDQVGMDRQYNGGDIIRNTSTNLSNRSFETTSAGDTLFWDGRLNGSGPQVPLKINGNVSIKALNFDGIIKTLSPVTFRKATLPTEDPDDNNTTVARHGHLQFEVAAGRKLEVHVDHNVTFEGFNTGPESAPKPHDIILSFKGRGQTIFRMKNGTAIKFMGEVDQSNRVRVLDGNTFEGFSNNGGGTKVFITMDQTQADIDAGISKLVFERKDFEDESQRVIKVVGFNSIFTFVSDDPTGVAHLSDPSRGGFASVTSDPSNKGSGRSIWFVQGAYQLGSTTGDFTPDDPEYNEIQYVYPFNDGAIVVAGHKVNSYSQNDIRKTLNYSVPAGGQAIFKITDDLAYNNRSISTPFDPQIADRRGELVINDVQSVSKRASDPYLDFFNTDDVILGLESNTEVLKKPLDLVKTKIMAMRQSHKKASTDKTTREGTAGICDGDSSIGQFWSYSWGIDATRNRRNVRTGFVLGINGKLDVYHNTFFDYVAGSINKRDLLAQCDYSCSDIKLKNPAAFIVDGLDTTLYSMGLSLFQAGNPLTQANPTTAEITLRGEAVAYFRCSGSEKFMYIFNLLNGPLDEELEGDEETPFDQRELLALDLPTFDWDAALIVADSIFDGCRLDPQSVHVKKYGEGNHVVEVEGKLVVTSVSNLTIVDPVTGDPRIYANEFTDAGVINMPTIAIDFAGLELADRPLVRGNSYLQYNSPALFFNNNACFFNTNIVHSDLTKRQQLVPTTADPAHTGGERFFFANQRFIFDGSDRNRFRWPEIQLYNSTIDLWESLTSAGVRYVIKDIPGKRRATDGSNKSIIRFFDHGDVNDTLFKCHGRVFMLGSCLNTMCDGKTNWITESAYVNVFKGNRLPVDEDEKAATATLSLQNGNQFPAEVDPADYDAQRAIHPIVMSILPCGSANMAIGWQTIEGDCSGTGYPYGNSTYLNAAVIEKRSTNPANLCTLDALTVPPACISIDGTNIAFAAYDKCGAHIKNPICKLDESGVVYVLHGGLIRIAGPDCDDRTGASFHTIISTIIANKVWNDYNLAGTRRVISLTGRVDLPQDQVDFDENGAVQPICLTDEMFAARSLDTDGYVRLSYYNQQRECQIDKSGAEEVVFNWCNRNGDNQLNAVGVHPTFRLPMNLTRASKNRSQAITRATESIGTPITRPSNLLYVGQGDDIKQIRVAGATLVDPFTLDVRGGKVREFVSIHGGCNSAVCNPVGVGDHARLFVEEGGEIGLGQRNWDQHSNLDPWCVLGKDHVQIIPLGHGTVNLNSNLIIADRQALIASTQFAADGVQRITFYSEAPCEIRVPSHGELDLSSFGQSGFRQEIAFGGHAKLVLEEGATIRFPGSSTTLRDVVGGVVLYFNESSELVFEGRGQAREARPRYETAEAANRDKIKIKGIGQIWANKDAQIQMNGNVAVSVCSDNLTPRTHITISLQGQANWNIGTSQLSGGSFEVGNLPTDNDEDQEEEGEEESVTKTVRFKFVTNGTGAGWTIERNGLVGFGVGVIDKNQTALNGNADRSNNPVIDTTTRLALLDSNGFPIFTPDIQNGTTITALADVTNITLELNQGFLHHNNIADGSDRQASAMLIGPVSENYVLSLNSFDNANLRGGGNVCKIPVNTNNPLGTIFNLNIWDFAGPKPDGSQDSIMAQSLMVLDNPPLDQTAVPFGDAPGATFTMNQSGMFGALTQLPVSVQLRPRASVDGLDDGDDTKVGYVNVNVVDPEAVYLPAAPRVIRQESAMITGGQSAEATDSGVVAVWGNGSSNPQQFGIIPAGN